MRRSKKDTANQPETQWTGRLIELACKSKAVDLVRLGEGGEYTQDEFNRICADRQMRPDDGGDTPGEIAVYVGWMRDPITAEELRRAHYLGSRAFFFVDPSPVAGLEWWLDMLRERFEIVEIEDNGSHIIGHARPLALVGEIRSKSAVDHETRAHNMRLNSRFYRRRMFPDDFHGTTQPPHGQKAILVCAGPSLRETWPSVKFSQAQGDFVVTCSMAYRFMMDRGIRPDAHVECDPRAHKVTQIVPIEPQGTEFWLASCVSPDWQDHVGDAVLWHADNGPESREVVRQIEPRQGLVCGGGSAGLRSLSLLYVRGFRHVSIHGMDCSFDGDGGQHAGEHHGKAMPELPIRVGKREFRSSPIMVAYARYFATTVESMPDMAINLAGDGLLQAMYGKR